MVGIAERRFEPLKPLNNAQSEGSCDTVSVSYIWMIGATMQSANRIF